MNLQNMRMNKKFLALPSDKIARNLSITRTPAVKVAEQVKQLREPNLQETMNKANIQRVMRESASEEGSSTASDETETQEQGVKKSSGGKWKIVLAGVVSLSVLGGIGYYALKE